MILVVPRLIRAQRSQVSGPRGSQRGFTLLEIMVAMGLVAMIVALVFPSLESMLRFGQKQQTHARIVAAAAAIENAYRQDAMAVDGGTQSSGAMMCLNADCSASLSTTPGGATPPAGDALSPSVASGLSAIAQQQGIPIGKLAVDGYAKQFAFFVSDRLTATAGPTDAVVYYHVIAIVSSEGNNALSSATVFNPSTGALTLAPNDVGEVVSGLPIQISLMQETLTRMQSVAAAYGTYFSTQYLASTGRASAVDYFANAGTTGSALFDPAGDIGNTADAGSAGDPFPGDPSSALTNGAMSLHYCEPATTLSGFGSTLGFPPALLTSAWGFPLAVCNGGPGDGYTPPGGTGPKFVSRNPANDTSSALQSPPYTAAIEAWAPGGQVLSIPITGTY